MKALRWVKENTLQRTKTLKLIYTMFCSTRYITTTTTTISTIKRTCLGYPTLPSRNQFRGNLSYPQFMRV